MRARDGRAWAWLALLTACGSSLHYELELASTVDSLSNGARVVVLPDDTADLVAIAAYYDVGGDADPPGKRGLAHLAEHVSFEVPYDGATIGQALHARAVFDNAFTFPEATVFLSVVRPEDVARALELEGARLR